jgi:hypothetical protein
MTDRTGAPPGAVAAALSRLRAALEGADREATLAAARALRDALLADPSRIAEAVCLLADAASPPAARAAVAAVLGSLPGEAGKRALLEALRGGTLEGGVERAALAALGALPPGAGEDAFDAGAHPYALELAPGLALVVRGPIADPAARAALLERLSGGGDPETRLAAARTLRDSAAAPEVRDALLERLARETDPEVAAAAGGALGAWAREVGPGDPARAPVVERLLAAVAASDEALRVSVAPALGSAALTAEEAGRLRGLAGSADADVRRFAVEALAWQLGRADGATEENLALLARAAAEDASADVRRAGVDALERRAHEEAAASALAASLSRDPDARVREAAARGLRRAHASSAAWTALRRAAASDPSPDVRLEAEATLELFARSSTER